MSLKLQDSVAVITGISSGIGSSIARHLAAAGATVIGTYHHSREKAEDVVREICAGGTSALCREADVRNFSAMEELAAAVVEQFGRIDILVNNAGITRDQLLLAMTEQDFRDVIETNLCGAFNATKAVAQQMMLQKRGRIINISSVAGERGGRGQTNYAASKGGLNAFTRAAAIELAPKKITVNAIAPGVIETEMSKEVMRRAQDQVLNHIPLKRLGTADEVASLVVFLATDDAAYITGEIIRVDGGFRG
jgi:3-oxoacyl-[acyl-carrier protein] reductase